MSVIREALLNVEKAARELDGHFDGSPGEWTLDGTPVSEDTATALLSLHDYLNDAKREHDAFAAVKAPDPLRQSSIARFDSCALSLLLDAMTPVRTSGDLAARGSLFHEWVARALRQMRAEGWDSYPVEMGLELLLHVLAQADVEQVVHLPMKELRWLRVLVTKWCEGGSFNARRIVAIEERLEMPLMVPDGRGGLYERVITGKPDVLVADPSAHGNGMIIPDWKTGWAPPAKLTGEMAQRRDDAGQGEDPQEKLTDQGYAQQVIYGALVLHNYPAIQRVTLREAYVMYGEYREATIERYQLERVLDILAATVAQIDQAFAEGPDSERWIPTAGMHCATCPAPRRCPLKDWEGIPETLEEAQLLAREWHVGAVVRKDREPLIKGWVDQHGPIPIDHAKGRREVGWVANKTGNGRRFVMHEPEDAPASQFDERMMEVLRART